MKPQILASLFAALSFACSASPKQPVETGEVDWQRDLDAALTHSRETGKPIFALFQEVPGCAGCKQFGRDVLSDPLIVDAIENEFVPLLVHNNQPGKDAEVLKRFKEPAWNYQVVRFLNHEGGDIIPRKDKVWTSGPLAERMVRVLGKSRREVPAYLSLAKVEHSDNLKSAAFEMFCFWTGEMKLGQIDGVVTTEAGFINGREVTLVQYDPATISLPDLAAAAAKVECARSVYLPTSDRGALSRTRLKTGKLEGYRAAPAKDQKKQLSRISVSQLALSEAQLTKLNAWLPIDRERALSYLSPAQRSRFAR